MSVIYVLLPVALVFAAVFVYVFIRSAHGGQFDDLDTPPVRILHDDEPEPGPPPEPESPEEPK